MALTGGHHDSLLIPPLKLPWREARSLGYLAGCEALIHIHHRVTTCKEQSYLNCLKHNCMKMLHSY